RCIADSRQQQQDAVPAHLIPRVLQNSQKRKNVLDVRGFEELEPTPLLERNLPIRKLDLQIRRHVAGAEQHRDVIEGSSFLVQLQNPIDNELRLLLLIAGCDEPRQLTTRTNGEEIFGETLGGARDQRVGNVENRLGGAEILLGRG